jgi:L-asparaginase II
MVVGKVIPKVPTYRSDKWLRAVASLPCVKCGREGMTQAAHRNEGKGMGIKTDDCLTAALCVACHALIDQGPTMTRDERRSVMDLAILMTLVRLAREGLVKP